MLIGEVAAKTGLSRDTIRYYEKTGLLGKRKKIRRNNAYQEYSEDDVKKLFFVLLCKEYGFTLAEIVELIGRHENQEDIFKLLPQRLERKIMAVDMQLRELLTVKLRLQTLLESL